jgi:hypothetical protein
LILSLIIFLKLEDITVKLLKSYKDENTNTPVAVNKPVFL